MTLDSSTFEVVLLLPDGEERSIPVGVNEHIWDAAFATGIVLPALCHQGRCLTCAGRLETTGEVDQSDSVSYYPQDRAPRYASAPINKPKCANTVLSKASPRRTHRESALAVRLMC
jgi:hypothetical protein